MLPQSVQKFREVPGAAVGLSDQGIEMCGDCVHTLAVTKGDVVPSEIEDGE